MANRIAGITVEIGGDTTKLNKALETANGTIKGTQSQLKDVEKLLKLDPTNTELLAQKQSLLTQAVAGTSEKLDVLKTAAQQAQTQLDQGKITQEQFNALQREIAETSNTMEQYNGKLSDSNSASAKLKTTTSQQESELSSLKKQYTDVVLEQGKDSDAAKDLQSKYDQLNSELTDNKNKMSTAESAASALGKANQSVVTSSVNSSNAIPQIIDNKTWERVQKRMSDRKHRAVNKAKREYLLSGLIECADCGATYVGHTSTNSKGYSTRYYCCGNKYRTHSCNSKNINADEIETFVVQNLKMYLLGLNFEKMAHEIADRVNNASPDLSAERRELADINAKINNGTRAVLNGLDYPELQTELFKLRVRKSELEDILSRSSKKNSVSAEKIIEMFQHSIDNWDTDLKNILKSMIKIYAHADGSFDLNIGVHILAKERLF